MSNVIQFLESMGGNASMARMTTADYEAAIAMLDADDASRRALRLRDHSTLNELLNGRRKMMFAVAAPEESPAEEQNPGDGDGDDEKQQAE